MAPALTISQQTSTTPSAPAKLSPYLPVVSDTIEETILHRTPWTPPVAVSGKGIYVELKDGRTVIDAVGGAAVACIGVGHPEVVKAIQEQAEKMAYVYNMQLSNEPAELLSKNLVETSKGAFASAGFVSGGSEAMEAAIKLARQYFFEISQPQRTNFIARKLSFHGNTLATLSLGYHPIRRGPYAPLLQTTSFHHVSPAYQRRFGQDLSEEEYVEKLKKELDEKFVELGGDTVCAFVAETVVGATTGVVPAPKGYFKAMKEVCDKYGALLVLDEVMSGMGRMGTLHAWESFGDGVKPDIQAVAKGLGGGYASIGAVLMSKQVSDGIKQGSGYWQHGHTYQAHPIACAASLAVQHVIHSTSLLSNVNPQGALLSSLLRSSLLSPSHPASEYIADIRGGGLFWGIEFEVPLPPPNGTSRFGTLVQEKAFNRNLIIIGMSGGADLEGKKGDHAILSPAYNVTKEEIEIIAERFSEAVKDAIEAYLGTA